MKQMAGDVFPIRQPIYATETGDESVEYRPSWITRRLVDAKIITMPTTAPPRFVNWTVVTGLCAVATFILLLLGIICAGAWYMSAQSAQLQQISKQADEAKAAAEEAKKLATYAASAADVSSGHAPQTKKK